jgi:hypothetical protein
MAPSKNKGKAQPVRDDSPTEGIKQQPGAGQVELLLPPIFPANAVVDPVDGTLRESVLKAPLPIGFSAWNDLPPAGETGAIALEWAPAKGDGSEPDPTVYVGIADEMVPGPLDPATYFPKTLDIPVTNLAVDGKFYLRLRMDPYNGLASIYSVPVPVTCDDIGPYEDATPLVMELVPDEVTDASFGADDEVVGGIPYYPDYQPGDRVAYFWAQPPFPEDWSAMVPVNTVPVDGSNWPFLVSYPGAQIRAKGDGTWYPVYGLVDKATNPSKLSAQLRVTVALGPLPSDLQPPAVPLAADELLTLKDLMAGVDVRIRSFLNHKPTDQIMITWGATQLAGHPVGSGNFPIDIPIPPAVLIDTYGDATGRILTNVSYTVLRGGQDSAVQAVDVWVDFSILGR